MVVEAPGPAAGTASSQQQKEEEVVEGEELAQGLAWVVISVVLLPQAAASSLSLERRRSRAARSDLQGAGQV